jgi:hypothetical protein
MDEKREDDTEGQRRLPAIPDEDDTEGQRRLPAIPDEDDTEGQRVRMDNG